jgi:hypothetical protein
MAKEVETRLIDDLVKARTGERVLASQQVKFAVNDVKYEIDLTDDNAAEFFRMMKPYMAAATEVKIRQLPTRRPSAPRAPTEKVASSPSTKTRTDRERTDAIRLWAKNNNFQVSDRGRIPGTVLTAYEEAGSPTLDALHGGPSVNHGTHEDFTPSAGENYSYAG